jgi:hypothetical protein
MVAGRKLRRIGIVRPSMYGAGALAVAARMPSIFDRKYVPKSSADADDEA